jgi:outer membrane lipoprotein LolB
MRVRALAAGLVLALLAACATLKVAERDPRPFDLLGRVLVAYSGGALTANVRWQHSAAQDEIWLMTPTGQTVAHIVDGPDGAVLTRQDQKQYRASSVEALTQQALGWVLPLSLLQYWVRGEPAPGSPVSEVQRGDDKALTALAQNGWRVSFTHADSTGEPGRVRRLQMNDGVNEIRFVIDTWRDVSAP